MGSLKNGSYGREVIGRFLKEREVMGGEVVKREGTEREVMERKIMGRGCWEFY